MRKESNAGLLVGEATDKPSADTADPGECDIRDPSGEASEDYGSQFDQEQPDDKPNCHSATAEHAEQPAGEPHARQAARHELPQSDVDANGGWWHATNADAADNADWNRVLLITCNVQYGSTVGHADQFGCSSV